MCNNLLEAQIFGGIVKRFLMALLTVLLVGTLFTPAQASELYLQTGTVTFKDSTPAAGVKLSFTDTITNTTTSVKTNSNGQFSAAISPGKFNVSLVVPLSSVNYSAYSNHLQSSFSVDLDSSTDPLDIQVPNRQNLTFRFVNESGLGVPSVKVSKAGFGFWNHGNTEIMNVGGVLARSGLYVSKDSDFLGAPVRVPTFQLEDEPVATQNFTYRYINGLGQTVSKNMPRDGWADGVQEFVLPDIPNVKISKSGVTTKKGLVKVTGLFEELNDAKSLGLEREFKLYWRQQYVPGVWPVAWTGVKGTYLLKAGNRVTLTANLKTRIGKKVQFVIRGVDFTVASSNVITTVK